MEWANKIFGFATSKAMKPEEIKSRFDAIKSEYKQEKKVLAPENMEKIKKLQVILTENKMNPGLSMRAIPWIGYYGKL